MGPDPASGSWFFTYPGSRIQGSKRHRIPDPQHCLLLRINFRNFCWRASLVQPSQVQWCERAGALAARPPRPSSTQSGRRQSAVQSGSPGTSPSQSHQVSLCTYPVTAKLFFLINLFCRTSLYLRCIYRTVKTQDRKRITIHLPDLCRTGCRHSTVRY
jgi:hypothetical protein